MTLLWGHHRGGCGRGAVGVWGGLRDTFGITARAWAALCPPESPIHCRHYFANSDRARSAWMFFVPRRRKTLVFSVWHEHGPTQHGQLLLPCSWVESWEAFVSWEKKPRGENKNMRNEASFPLSICSKVCLSQVKLKTKGPSSWTQVFLCFPVIHT